MTECGSDPPDKGCKVPGSHTAVGYWGGSVYQRVFAEQEHARQRALLTDQIIAGSLRVALWIGATEDDGGNRCACYKESNQQADRKCGACHGVGFVPGYYKFGYNTVFMSGVDDDVTFTGTELTTGWKSAKIVLQDGVLSGTVESGDKPFDRNVLGAVWESEALYFLPEDTESSVTVEYSLDAGSSWSDLSTLVTTNPASGNIRFRTTIARDSAAVISPQFEIVRARYSRIPLTMPVGDGSYRMGPWILAMREPPTTRSRKYEYGDIPVEDGLSFWTAGLAFFDPDVAYGSDEELLKGPLTFVEILDGARVGSRYVATTWQNSDPFGYILVSQTFQIRIADPAGPIHIVY
jgi:hypothetical protein